VAKIQKVSLFDDESTNVTKSSYRYKSNLIKPYLCKRFKTSYPTIRLLKKLLSMVLMECIYNKAKQAGKCTVLFVITEKRTLKATDFILNKDIACIILWGDASKNASLTGKRALVNNSRATVINPRNNPRKAEFAETFYSIGKNSRLIPNEAEKLVESKLYPATLIIKKGEVAGADNATAGFPRPAFRIIETLPGINVVFGVFIQAFKTRKHMPTGVMAFADCAVHPDKGDVESARIVVGTAQTARNIAGIQPRVEIPGFVAKSSSTHPLFDKAIRATKLACEPKPSPEVDCETQSDTAIADQGGIHKASCSHVAGKVNVLIFPGLQPGNIVNTLVQLLSGSETAGQMLQGLAVPVNDLSRGCQVGNIVKLLAITAIQAAGTN